MVPTEDRLPAEQLIANAVRQVVYDPSVLVRSELAVLYARFVRGHATAVEDSLSATQRKLNDFLRTQQGSSSAQQPSRRSMEQNQLPVPQERAVGAVGSVLPSGSLPSETPGSAEKDQDSASVQRVAAGPYGTILESMQVGRALTLSSCRSLLTVWSSTRCLPLIPPPRSLG